MDRDYGAAYADLYHRHWWFRARERIVLDEVGRIAAGRRMRALDVGCGDGLLFPALSDIADVEGIEPGEHIVGEASATHGRIHIRPFDDSFNPDCRYDLVLMLDVLEHLDAPAEALRHVVRLLAPGGRALITVPAFRALWTTHDTLNHHRTRYTRAELHQLAAISGLRIERERYFFHWLTPLKLAVRAKEALTRPRPTVPSVPPALLNRLLARLSVAEFRVTEPFRLPFGTSLLAVARTEPDQAFTHSG